jgi:hypothetical protein
MPIRFAAPAPSAATQYRHTVDLYRRETLSSPCSSGFMEAPEGEDYRDARPGDHRPPGSADNREELMKTIVLAAVLSLMASSAFATCKSDAADKKLAGAALKSFMTKCEKDAAATCATDSASKKLAGAAKTSHMKKCTTDAVGL